MPMSARLLRPRSTGFHPEAQDWRNRVIANGGTVSGSTLAAVSNFCSSIDADGLRDRFLRLNLFCGTSSANLAAVRTPLYRGQSRAGTQLGGTTDTNVNFVQGDYAETGASGGLDGNGSTKYLNTGLAANSTAYGDRHLCVYEIAKSPNAFDISIGARSSSPQTYFELTTSNPASNFLFRSSDAVTSASESGYTAAGAMMMGVHPSTHTGVLYRNGASVGTANFASRTNSYSGNVFVFAGNSDGSPSDHADIRLGGYSIGLAMTAAQALAYYNTMQAFQAALFRDRPSSDPAFASVTNADAKLWIDNVYANGGTVSTSTAAAVNTFCNSIDAAGIRDRFFRLNLFAGSNLSAALVPLYRGQSRTGSQFGNTTDTNANFVSGDYAETGSSGGLLGNTNSKYLNTGFTPNTLPFGNAHLCGYLNLVPSTTFAAIMQALSASGGDELGLVSTQSSTSTPSFFSEENTATGFVQAATNNAAGMILGSSVSSTDRRIYVNASQSGSTVTNALTRSQYSNQSLFVMARNFQGSPTGYNNGRICAYSFGVGMTGSQVSAFYSAMQAFQTALGRNV